MSRWLYAFAPALLLIGPAAHAELYYLIVAGLGGNADYAERFAADVDELAKAARRTTGDDARVKVLAGDEATRDALRAQLVELAGALRASDRLAVFLVGHGSYDGQTYKFNLPGPDIDGAELGRLLAAVPARPQLIVNATSASGAILEDWSMDDRILVTATRSGAERNATRFAEQWADALSAAEADTNKNGVISADEAFEYASRKVADSYDAEGTLATEHPQLKGDSAGRFEAARLTARPAATTPEAARLNAQREDLEEQIADLRERKDQIPDDEYLDQLQDLLVKLATVQKQIDAANAGDGPD
jgi:hypothetical protein